MSDEENIEEGYKCEGIRQEEEGNELMWKLHLTLHLQP